MGVETVHDVLRERVCMKRTYDGYNNSRGEGGRMEKERGRNERKERREIGKIRRDERDRGEGSAQ